MKVTRRTIVLALASLGIISRTGFAASGSAFTYQGRLSTSTNVANQPYDMVFKLYDSSAGGTQIGSAVTTNGVSISNGLFVVTLDFGASAFSGANRWLEIGVAPSQLPPLTPTTLSPRQFIAAAPYAITASNLSGTLPATQLSGTIQSSQFAGTYSGAVNFNNSANTFIGNGSGLLGVDAVTLGGYGYCNLPCYWKLTGNSGTTPGVNFVGTTDNQPLELKVFGNRALRLEPNATSPNVLEGYMKNSVAPGVFGGTIGGGGSAFSENSLAGNFSTIGGGQSNQLSSAFGTIGGGATNLIEHGFTSSDSGQFATIGGGSGNVVGVEDTTGSFGSTVGGGIKNFIGSSWYSSIAGGSGNTIRSHDDVYSATIGGGLINTIANSSFGVTIAGGAGNYSEAASYATISGGQSNLIYAFATGATIAGGSGNQIPQTDPPTPYATISGGQGNTNEGPYGIIAGGLGNLVISAYGVIGGGASNTITRELPGSHDFSLYSTIGGGLGNLIGVGDTQGSLASTIGGGTSNFIGSSFNCTIAGGLGNFISSHDNSAFDTIGGGEGNILYVGGAATIAGGNGNSIGGGVFAAIGGGQTNFIFGAGAATISGGSGNLINGPAINRSYAAIGGGASNLVTSIYGTIPGGGQAMAQNYGQMAYASGQFAAPGDAQTSVYVCRATTTSATTADLFLDGVSQRMVLPANSTWAFEMLITGRASGGNSAAYRIFGSIKNNAGTTSLLGTLTKTVIGEDVAAWDANVVADDVNDSLAIRVNGASGTTIRWVAEVRTVEVNF